MSFRHTRFPPRPALTLNDLQRWLSSSLIVAICAGHLLIESIRYETNRPNSALWCGVRVLGFFGRGGELLLGFLQSVSEAADSLAEALVLFFMQPAAAVPPSALIQLLDLAAFCPLNLQPSSIQHSCASCTSPLVFGGG